LRQGRAGEDRTAAQISSSRRIEHKREGVCAWVNVSYRKRMKGEGKSIDAPPSSNHTNRNCQSEMSSSGLSGPLNQARDTYYCTVLAPAQAAAQGQQAEHSEQQLDHQQVLLVSLQQPSVATALCHGL
jgi:hypothetical protein